MNLSRSKKLFSAGLLVVVNLALLAWLVFGGGGIGRASTPASPEAGGDTCAAATIAIGALPYNDAGTTVGMTDNYDLPPDTTNPTCLSATTGTGGGPAGAAPRGGIYTGTGTAPDAAYEFTTDVACALTITLDPTGAEDLALIVYDTQCTSSLNDCVVVDDDGIGGTAESVIVNALAGHKYYAVADGYSTAGTPPGPSGPYTMNITGSGCRLIDPAVEVCGVVAAGTYTFSSTPNLSISVPTAGDLNCISAVKTVGAIPNGTANMTDGYYWTLTGLNAASAPASGFTVDMTFPHLGGTNPALCRYTGAPGVGWDCGGTAGASTVTRTGVTNFSTWAIGYNVGPTSVELGQTSAAANRSASPWLLAALAFSLVSLGGAAFLLRKR